LRRAKGEGSVYRRKDGLWAGRYLVEGKRKYVYGKTKKAAADKLREKMHEERPDVDSVAAVSVDAGLMEAGPKDPNTTGRGECVPHGEEGQEESPLTFGAFLWQWLSTVRGRVKQRTYERDENDVRLHLVPSLGEIELARLTPLDLERLLSSKLAAGLSPRSVQIVRATANKALKQAVAWSLIEKNPAAAVRGPKTVKKEVRTLSACEVKGLLSAVEGQSLEALYLLAVTTGMRQGELLALKWEDFDYERGVIKVQRTVWRGETYPPKTAKANRSIRLTSQALSLLREKEEKTRVTGDPEWIFPSRTGTPINRHNLTKRSWWPLLRGLGLPRMPFHNLRHTCATLLLSQGVLPKLVQELLGHADIGTTLNTYSHVIPSLEGKTASAMEQILE
jgi:integrase